MALVQQHLQELLGPPVTGGAERPRVGESELCPHLEEHLADGPCDEPGRLVIGGRRRRTTRGAHTGARSVNPSAASIAAAERITTRSPCWGPTSCRPMGNPADDRPTGREAAGERVMLKG